MLCPDTFHGNSKTKMQHDYGMCPPGCLLSGCSPSPPQPMRKSPFPQDSSPPSQSQHSARYLSTLHAISMTRVSRQHRACLFKLASGDAAGYALLLPQAIVPRVVLGLWKGAVCYKGSLQCLAIPWNLQAALKNSLWLYYSFLTLKDYLE